MSNPFLIRSPLGGDYEISLTIPDQIRYSVLPLAVPYFVAGEWGHIIFQQLTLDGVEIWDSQFSLNTPVEIAGSTNTSFIEIYNSVNNHFISQCDNVVMQTKRQGQGGVCAGPYINNFACFPGQGKYRTVDFHFTPEYLIPYAAVYPKLDKMMNNFYKGNFAHIEGILVHSGMMGAVLQHVFDPLVRHAMLFMYYRNKASEFVQLALESLDPPGRALAQRPASVELADTIADYIRDNFRQVLSLDEIAKAHYTSLPTMQRVFQKRYQLPVHQYILYTRIEEAKRLLSETSDDLESISLLTMFSDAQHLCKVFKKFTGKTPGHYRQSRRG